MRTIAKKAKKYATVAKVSFQNATAYRAAVLARFAFYALFIYTFARLWGVVFGGNGGMPGFTLTQTIWYLIIAELMTFTCGGGVYRALNDEVKTGSIAYLLGRPTHFIAYQLANEIGNMLMNLICFGAFAAVLGFVFAGPLPGFTPASLPGFAVSFLLGILLNYFFMMSIALTAFTLEDNLAIYLIYQKASFMLGMLLPVEFLPPLLQRVARALPFSYVFWAPARLFVGYSRDLFWELVPRQALWCAAVAALSLIAYRAGVRRLQINGG
jgi:ABC-2 type transport system permease protein